MSKPNVSISLGGSPIFLIFLILKLTGTVAWSWWIVTLPLWLPLVTFLGFFAVVAFFAMIGALLS